MTDIAVIILTGNEELHIARCLEKLRSLESRQVFVVDCFSKDRTVEIAKKMGAVVVEHAWPGLYALQFNWALDNCPITTKWVLRLDADEYLFSETCDEVKAVLPTLPDRVTSLSLPLARVWQGVRIKHGVNDVILTRFFRFGKGRCEIRMMDEHIQTTEGECRQLKGAFIDDNLNGIGWWTEKHVGYALREALDLLRIEYGPVEAGNNGLNTQASLKRKRKVRYARMPLYWRSFAYFCVRYFLKGGFLDGRAGFTWNFFQGWWYRTLVDARVEEIKRATGVDRDSSNAWEQIRKYVEREYRIKI